MEQLGIQPIQLLMQAINFGILLVLLTKFLYTPMMKALDARKKKIAEGLAYSEKMKKESEKLEDKHNEVLAKARTEAKSVIEEAKKSAKAVAEQITADAKEEAKGIVEKGKRDVEAEREQMIKDVRSQTVELAVRMTEKVLADVLTGQAQKTLIDKKIKEIERQVQ